MARRKSGLERIVSGLTAGAVIWGLWTFHWLPLPLGSVVFLGVVFTVFPVLRGVRQITRDVADGGRSRRLAQEEERNRLQDRRDNLEKTVLQVARERRGVVTPALVVLHSDLKLDEAEQVLNTLASRGYAEMRVKDNGTIDYVFHDLV